MIANVIAGVLAPKSGAVLPVELFTLQADTITAYSLVMEL